MTSRRILAIKLLERIKENQEYANKIGVAASIKVLPPNEGKNRHDNLKKCS